MVRVLGGRYGRRVSALTVNGERRQTWTKRKRLNADQKRALISSDLRSFADGFARRAQRNTEPNDRRFDPEAEHRIRHMKPEDLDRLLREDED